MNVNSGQIYDSFDSAVAAGEHPRDLVQGERETLEQLKKRLKLRSRYQPHHGARERARRITHRDRG